MWIAFGIIVRTFHETGSSYKYAACVTPERAGKSLNFWPANLVFKCITLGLRIYRIKAKRVSGNDTVDSPVI